MIRNMSIIIIICLCLIFSMKVRTFAQPMPGPTNIQEQMKEHIEKMKFKNPKKYQEMVERAKSTITYCTDCHVEVAEKSKSPTKGKTEGIPPTRR